MLKFASSYVPEPKDGQEHIKIGLDLSEYLKQAGIKDLLDPKERIVGTEISVNDKIYHVLSWEIGDDHGWLLTLLPKKEKKTDGSTSHPY